MVSAWKLPQTQLLKVLIFDRGPEAVVLREKLEARDKLGSTQQRYTYIGSFFPKSLAGDSAALSKLDSK